MARTYVAGGWPKVCTYRARTGTLAPNFLPQNSRIYFLLDRRLGQVGAIGGLADVRLEPKRGTRADSSKLPPGPEGEHHKRRGGRAGHRMDLADRQAWPKILDRGSQERAPEIPVGCGKHGWRGQGVLRRFFGDTGLTGGER